MTGTALLRMIYSQADALDRIARLDLAGPAEVLARARRILLVGTGTSLHAAELGAMMLTRAGRDAYAYPAAAWARWGTGPRATDAVCVITHTAETAYAARARADALGSPEGSPEQLALATAQVRHACADPGPDAAAVAMPARALAIAGCGPWAVTAREGALKIREAARMLAEGFDTDRLLHGGAVPYTAADGLVVLEPGADPDGLTGAVADAARAEGLPVSVLAAPDGGGGLAPLLAQIPMTVRLQLLAETFARLRHQNPDAAIV